MKVLVTSGWKPEAYCAMKELNFAYVEVKTTEDIALAAPNLGFLKVPLPVEELKDIISKLAITHIFPFDTFSFWVGFDKESNTKVISNSFHVCYSTTNMFEFLKVCKKNGIPCPASFRSNNEIDRFPLLMRSKDKKEIQILRTMRDVFNFTSTRKDVVVQEVKQGVIVEIDFIGSWKQTRIFYPNSSAFQLSNIDFPIRKNTQDAFGLEFGTLQFIMAKDGIFLTDAYPYITYNGLLCLENGIESIINHMEKKPFQVKSKFKVGEHIVVCPEARRV